jgi:peptidoglycan/LPS O-acetylase OafA/YrhL
VSGPGPRAPGVRHGGLDALRALAMLLGLTYHAAYAYVPGVGPWYPVADAAHHEGFRVLAGVLHAVRMPVFFALAGFFAHLGLGRRGPGGFLGERARRLLVPFAVALPLTWAADLGVRTWSQRAGLMDPAFGPGAAPRWGPLHLWFLEYLFLFSLGAAALARGGLPAAWRAGPRTPWLAAGLLAAATMGVAALHGELRPDASLVPEPAALAEYGAFFTYGVVLAASPGATPRWAAWLAPLGLGLALVVHTRHLQWEAPGYALDLAAGWLVAVGGLAAALGAGPGEVGSSSAALGGPPGPVPWSRPLVAAAYWVYLVHYPLVGAFQVVLAQFPAPAVLKYAAVVLGSLAVSLGTFEALVKRTWLGPWVGVTAQPGRP